MTVALYARVSTSNGQDTTNQLRQLRAYCRKKGHKIVGEYVDRQSGGDADREQFQRLLADANQRKFDLILFWALDRFSREGVLRTLQYLQMLDGAGVGWKSLTEQYLDSAGIFKDAIISIMATLAKQERLRMSERILAGLERAKAQGRQLGRPKKVFDRKKVVEMRKQGDSLGTIAKQLTVSRTTVHRLAREAGV